MFNVEIDGKFSKTTTRDNINILWNNHRERRDGEHLWEWRISSAGAGRSIVKNASSGFGGGWVEVDILRWWGDGTVGGDFEHNIQRFAGVDCGGMLLHGIKLDWVGVSAFGIYNWYVYWY